MVKDSTSRMKSKHKMHPSNERLKSAQHWSPLHKQKVSKRRKETKDAKARLSQGSLFESARNVEIAGGQFNSAQGHHANLTITVNQHAANDCLEGDETESPSDGRNSLVSLNNERDFTPIWNLPPLPVRRSCDIYYRHLAAKGRGSPMWEPEPSSTLPNAYRRRGMAVGDVGIITASGGFDFMFNICLPSDHPINQEGLPDGFSPILPQLRASDIRKRMAYNANSYLASESVVKSRRESDPSEIEFESSASEGAILTMPQGAHAEDLANVSHFRRYFSANAENWYRYINNIRGREAKNGDVRLVVGCDKTSSWGMATFSNSMAQDFHLKFKPTSESGSRRTYGWEYSAMVDARVGPDPEEMEELRSTDGSGNSSVYENQCLFVRTLNATLRDDVWKGLGLDCETAMHIQCDSYANSYGPGPSSINPSSRSPNFAGLSSSDSRTMGGSTRSSATTLLPWTTLPPVIIENFNTALTAHPSKTMNDFILTENPHARIAITVDGDWLSLITESDQRLPSPDELINRMLTSHDVCEADGMAFLQLKPKNQPIDINFKQSEGVNIPPVSVFESDSLEPLSHARLPVGFFSRSNVKITGGEFNQVHGNHAVYDQSRLQSDENSFSTTHRTISNSGNNNLSVYYGVARKNARHCHRAPSRSEESQASVKDQLWERVEMERKREKSRERKKEQKRAREERERMINIITEDGITLREHAKDKRSGMQRKEDDVEGEGAVKQHHLATARNPHSSFSERPEYGPGTFPATSSAQKDSYDEEKQDPRMTAPVSISTGMSNMSLDEDRSAYSQVNSNPQNPYHSYPAKRRSLPPPGIPHTAPHSQGGSKGGYGGAPLPLRLPGLMFNPIDGEGRSVHSTNIGSGNIRNALSSTVTLSSSQGFVTPPPLGSPYHTAPQPIIAHPVLEVTQTRFWNWDMSYPPQTATNLPSDIWTRAATQPAVGSMDIICERLPWRITIYPRLQGSYVTAADVLDGLHRALSISVTGAEFDLLPTADDKHAVTDAYLRRCKRRSTYALQVSEQKSGIRRVDFLRGWSEFGGLEYSKERWKLCHDHHDHQVPIAATPLNNHDTSTPNAPTPNALPSFLMMHTSAISNTPTP